MSQRNAEPAAKPAAPVASESSEDTVLADALARVRPRLEAIPETELASPALDIAQAVIVALGMLTVLRKFRDVIVATFVDFDLVEYDLIEDLARAAAMADARYQVVLGVPDELAMVLPDAVELRDRLVADADPLVTNNVLRRDQLATIRGGNGYRDTAMDLMVISELYRAVWPKVAGHTFVTQANLDKAMGYANKILVALAQREQTDPDVADAALLRRRAITALLRAVDEARRAVTYVRWHEGDADQLVPSLFVRSPASRKRDDKQPASTGPTPAQPAIPGAPTAAPANDAPAAPPANIPQNNPFLPK